mmetsp:Transcript_64393/g.168549  ORF Transcript_64393/g.168549 Transcript_64393/m.168549 type:complete len:213 (-) Transcript_64393:465-1103(-)
MADAHPADLLHGHHGREPSPAVRDDQVHLGLRRRARRAQRAIELPPLPRKRLRQGGQPQAGRLGRLRLEGGRVSDPHGGSHLLLPHHPPVDAAHSGRAPDHAQVLRRGHADPWLHSGQAHGRLRGHEGQRLRARRPLPHHAPHRVDALDPAPLRLRAAGRHRPDPARPRMPMAVGLRELRRHGPQRPGVGFCDRRRRDAVPGSFAHCSEEAD